MPEMETTKVDKGDFDSAAGTPTGSSSPPSTSLFRGPWLPDEMYHKLGQRAANYRPASELTRSCGVCQYYDPEYSRCMLVDGSIQADYVSDLFQPLGSIFKSEDGQELVPFRQVFKVKEADEYKQNVFGWANVSAVSKDFMVVDSHNDIIPIDVLEDAAYQFVLDFRAMGEMHSGAGEKASKGTLIESMVFTPEKLMKFAEDDGVVNEEDLKVLKRRLPSGWWTGFHVEDKDVFSKVVDGTYPMFSIQGLAVTVPEEVELVDV